MVRQAWTRDELIIAFNLYCKIPFGRIHIRNLQIIALAKAIGRTPSAVSWKLANFARLDPSLKERKIEGASHGGKGEVAVWNEFHGNWEKLAYESEKLLAQITGQRLEVIAKIEGEILPREGKERESVVRVRVNQNFFRAAVLAAYQYRCCITGLAVPELLNASHIDPWSNNPKVRMNPRNGLALNTLHDRAFDRGLITITTDFKVKVSARLKELPEHEALKSFFLSYHGKSILLPNRFAPDSEFLSYHNEKVFQG
ncbi:MAG: HNH endonuclease [Kiritimatiellia bacterium]|nr:HNH endonuclease [Kiritimatiellia bacterium]